MYNNKASGGLRPIAVGNILRRLTSKLFARALDTKMKTLLAPHQLGVGSRNGCETAVHTVKQAVKLSPDKWVLQLDLQNAFNRVNRSSMLAEVARVIPECLSWAVSCYGTPSHLQFGNSVLSSSSGVQQGDPLAGDLFAVSLQPVIEIIEGEVPTLAAHVWLHDDGTAVGTAEELQKVVDVVRREGPLRGLHLSEGPQGKSSIWSPSAPGTGDDDPLRRNIPRVQEAGIKLLGAPIGSSEYVVQFIKKRVEKIRDITTLLPSLHQPHLEFVLLRSCLALPKIVYLLRCTDTTSHADLLQEFDSITRDSLSRILGLPVSDQGWQQAKIPVSLGGLGLRTAEDHGGVAYASSFLACQPILRTLLHMGEEQDPISLPQELLSGVNDKFGEEEGVVSTEYLGGLNQKAASQKIDLRNQHLLFERLRHEGCVREIARLASVSLPKSHAGDWLTVVPSPGLGLLLRSPEFVAALRYRLGQPIFSRDGPCPACGKQSDKMGDHAMNCAWQGERIARHNCLRDALYKTAVSAALGPTKEGRFLLPGEGGKPADLFIPRWAGGKDAALDVTIVNPLQDALVQQAADTPGHALSVAHRRKLDKSWEPCHQQGIEFIPIAAESLGAWHSTAIKEVQKLGSSLARQNGDEEAVVVQQLFQQLSVSLMRGNAALFNNRCPPDSDNRDDDVRW